MSAAGEVARSTADADLPKGWIQARLGDHLVDDVQPGFACGRHDRDVMGVAHLRPMNVSSEGTIDLANVKYVPREEAERENRMLQAGDVLFNNTNSPELVGKTAYYGLPEPRAFSNHMTRLRCNQTVLNPQYGALVLHHLWRGGYFLRVCNNHVSQASVSRAVLLDTSVAVPPLAEQRRIVAAVEALMGRVEAAREYLARVPAILRRFRRAVLAAACSGRLTESWRGSNDGANRKSGHDLVRELGIGTALGANDTETEQGIPENWTTCAFGLLAENLDGRRVPLKSTDRQKRQGPYPYFGASGQIDSIDAYLFDGDYLLIAEDGANLLSRATPIAFPASGRFWVNNHAHVVRTKPGVLLAFVELVLNSLDFQNAVTGSAQPKLTQAALNRIPVPVPPSGEQSEIVRRVAALDAQTASIEKRAVAASNGCLILRQAILGKAFRGELVPTEAELARQEGRDYEPAAVLIERIRSQNSQGGASRRKVARARG